MDSGIYGERFTAFNDNYILTLNSIVNNREWVDMYGGYCEVYVVLRWRERRQREGRERKEKVEDF